MILYHPFYEINPVVDGVIILIVFCLYYICYGIKVK